MISINIFYCVIGYILLTITKVLDSLWTLFIGRFLVGKAYYNKKNSMTSFFVHKVAQPTQMKFLLKNLSQLVIFVVRLALT